MWYTAGERYAILDWISAGIQARHRSYRLRRFRDGIEWVKSKKPVLSPRLDAVRSYEAVVSKPGITLINGAYHMWLSVFTMQDGGGYRLNYARSKDGLHWERFTDEEVMPLTPGGFDWITSPTQMSLNKATNSGCSMSGTHLARRGSASRR